MHPFGRRTFGDTSTPVVVVTCQLAGLAIMRSLGRLGVSVHGVDGQRTAPAFRSRYCRGRLVLGFDAQRPERLLEGLLRLGRRLGRPSILIPTSDETAQFVANHAEALRGPFLFQDNPAATVRRLANKWEMCQLAVQHGVPTPETRVPRDLSDVVTYAGQGAFPVMLKRIFSNRSPARTRQDMEIVRSGSELLEAYRRMEDGSSPNVMIQELIPGGDDQVYIFNGYFNRRSECLAGFTGFKIRQSPVHVGCASLGECRWVEDVANTTMRFMEAVGYQGILDIGYRLDPRDGRFKVLDVNPRVGQAFRLFVARNDHDVVRALYLDLSGQEQPPVVRREGRRWLIEDLDLISSFHYFQEGALRPRQWLRSFKGVEEGAWFSWKDPVPFLGMLGRLVKQGVAWLGKRLAPRAARAGAAQPAVAK